MPALTAPPDAAAQYRPFGAGIILGEPTGLSAKYWFSQNHAADAGLAWSVGEADVIHGHVDYLHHNFDLLDEPRTALYYGIGVRLLAGEGDSYVGVRIPLGVTHLLRSAAFDFFFELVPILNLAPATEFDANVGVGARYFFERSDRQ